MTSTIALVTGANGGIGKAIARQLAQKGLEVVMLCRDAKKGQAALQEIVKATSNEKVSLEICDLSSYSSVVSFAQRYRESKKPLHVLINNAAIVPSSKSVTSDGLELQWATNVMSYYWLIEELLSVLKTSAPSRIVNVASQYAGDLDLSDVNFDRRRYESNTAYRQSKQANRMISAAYAPRLSEFKITINACHPGVVNTQLLDGLGFSGWESPDQGAATPVYLATTSEGATKTGKWFVSSKEKSESFTNKTENDKLLALCSDLTNKLKTKSASSSSSSSSSSGGSSSGGSSSSSS